MANERDSRVAVVHGCFPERSELIPCIYNIYMYRTLAKEGLS